MQESINLNKILYESLLKNKTLLIATLGLFLGFYLQDTLFSKRIAAITRNIPEFVNQVNKEKIAKLLLPFVAAVIIFYLTNIVISKNLSQIELDVTHDLTGKVIESIKTTKKKINVNELMIQVKKVTNTKNIYKLLGMYIIPTVVIILSLFYNFVKVDTLSGLMVVGLILALVFITTKLELNTINSVYDGEQSLNDLYDTVHETMTNIDTVITSSTKEKELNNLDTIKNNTFNLTYESELKNGNTTYGLQLLSLLAVVGINFISYTLYTKNIMSETKLITNVLLTLLFMDYYNYCINAIKEVSSNIGKLWDANQYFAEFKITPQNAAQVELNIQKGNLHFQNIVQKYNDENIFNNVTLFIAGNAKTGIIGPIGCGKSTLLKMIAGIVDFEGNILVDGQNLKDCTHESITKHIAYISQHPKLFNKSLLYNITYGTNLNETQVWKKLNEYGLTEFINSFPDKLQTMAGKEGSALSGGQKQLICFIRAIIQNKSIILLDEPSSSLDQNSKHTLLSLLRKLKNKTIIITTHDKDLFPLFDKIIDNPSKKTKAYEIHPHTKVNYFGEVID